jgi:hypothetical protein
LARVKLAATKTRHQDVERSTMSTKKGGQLADPATPDLAAVAQEWSELKELSGSASGHFTLALMNQVWRSLWVPDGTPSWIVELGQRAAQAALQGIGPRDPLEGMLAAQMVATHEATMECYRRAMRKDQSFEGRQAALSQANKLVRSYATLVETLDKHRGKGQQVVRVEHVTVQAGGQAIVGAVHHSGGGEDRKSEERAHAQQLTHAAEPTLRGADPQREPVPVAGRTW